MQVCSVTKNTMMASSQSSLSMKMLYGLNFTMGIKWYKKCGFGKVNCSSEDHFSDICFFPRQLEGGIHSSSVLILEWIQIKYCKYIRFPGFLISSYI